MVEVHLKKLKKIDQIENNIEEKKIENIIMVQNDISTWMVVAHLTSQQLTKARIVMQRTASSLTTLRLKI